MGYEWTIKYNEEGQPYGFWNQTDNPQYGSNDYANPEYLRQLLRKYSDYNKPSDWIQDSGGNELSIDQLQAAWHQKYKPEGFDSPIELLQQQQNRLLQGIEASKNSWYKIAQEGLQVKQPWEMTKNEFVEYQIDQRKMRMQPGILEQEEYAGMHQAPTSDEGAPGYDVTIDIYPDDIYGPMAAQYYGHYGQNHPTDMESIYQIQRMKNRPDKDIRIYRAVPKEFGGSKFNIGDWVTISRKYAKEHGDSQFDGNYRIISKVVKSRDIFTNGDSIHEWGYDPQERTPLQETPFKYLKKRHQEISTNILIDQHKEEIIQALSSGEEIPPEVLAEYPELIDSTSRDEGTMEFAISNSWYKIAQSKQIWEMTKDEFIPRIETIGKDQSLYPVGTRRIGEEGYVDTAIELSIDEINLQPENTINIETVEKYKETPSNKLPVITLEPNGTFLIDDGHHRIIAAKNNGEPTIKVWLRNATDWPRSATHKYIIQQAVFEEKPVPLEVLAEYPELIDFTSRDGGKIEFAAVDSWYKIAEISSDPEKLWLHRIKWSGPREIRNIPEELRIPEFYSKAIKIRGASVIRFIPEEILLKYPEICINAIKIDPNPRRTLVLIPEEVKSQNPEIYSKAIETDTLISEILPEEIIKQNPDATRKNIESKGNSWYKTAQQSLNIPEEYRETINDLVEKSKSVGLNIYATGGFVRDLISGAKIPKDLDVMVDVENEELYRQQIQPLIDNVNSDPINFVQNSLSGAKQVTNVNNLKIQDSENRQGLFFRVIANIDYIDQSGKVPKQINGEEFETSINPSLLLSSQYGKNVPRGEMFGIYAINTPIGEVEIAYPRTERYQKGSRKPITDMGTIDGDAMRRDFGMNALFVDLENGNISDPTGHGLQDIQEKKISVTDPPAIDIIFNDDPLRILRGIRFESTLPGFKLDSQILDYVKANPHLMAMKGTEITWDDEEFEPKLSSERIQEELTKILSSKNAPQAMNIMKEMGILNHVIKLPEEAEDWDLDQINPYHYENVWNHTITVMEKLQTVLDEQGIDDPEKRMILNLEALLHDTGKLIPEKGYQNVKTNENGEITHRRFAGHEDISAEIATNTLGRLKFPKNIIKRVSKILEYHNDLDKATVQDETKTTQFIDNLGTDIYDLLLLGMADRRAHVDSINDDTYLKDLYSSLTPERYDELENKTKPFVSGEEIKEILQIPPGPIIGLITKFIKESQINQLLNTKEEEQKLLGDLRKISDIIGKKIGPWIEKTLLLLVQSPMGEDPQSIYQWMVSNQRELIAEDNKPIIAPLINGNDLISMGIQPGPIFKEILNKILEQQIIGNISTKEEAIGMVPSVVSDIENEENDVDENNLKFSEYNMLYTDQMFKFAESEELIESTILKELKQENPNWETIDTFIGDVDHCSSIKDLYYADKDFAIETYEQILDEILTEEITASISRNKTVKAQNEQTQYGEVPAIDTSSPRDIGELESYFGASSGDAVGLVDAFPGASLDQIKYIGVSPETSFLGVTESDLTRQIMQNTINKMYEWSTQNGELTEEDINKIQSMKMEFEAELGESKLLAFRISPNRVIQEVNEIMNNIQQGIQNQPEQEEPINFENIKQDVLTLILGEVIAHEAVHAGGDTGESGPIEREREFLQHYLDSDRFLYLKDFVKLK